MGKGQIRRQRPNYGHTPHLRRSAQLQFTLARTGLGGGLKSSNGGWTDRLYFDPKKLMSMWRFAVITFLREALKAGVLTSDLPCGVLKAVLAREYRWWSIHVDYFQSK